MGICKRKNLNKNMLNDSRADKIEDFPLVHA